jgi:uncharacterized membrane protein YcaP (DUF421 family)
MSELAQILFGDWQQAPAVAIKAFTLFVTAAVLFRFKERRTLAEFAPYDWVAAVAVGAIVGRTATAADAAWLSGAVALIVIMVTHALVSRLRYSPKLRRFIDPPVLLLIRDGVVDRRNLRRCGRTEADLDAALRQHGYASPSAVHLAISEARGTVSILRGRGDE